MHTEGTTMDPCSTSSLFLISGADRDRTDYLLNAIQALSQMSYSPIYS